MVWCEYRLIYRNYCLQKKYLFTVCINEYRGNPSLNQSIFIQKFPFSPWHEIKYICTVFLYIMNTMNLPYFCSKEDQSLLQVGYSEKGSKAGVYELIFNLRYCWCNFPITGRLVFHNFPKGMEVSLTCAFRSTCFFMH